MLKAVYEVAALLDWKTRILGSIGSALATLDTDLFAAKAGKQNYISGYWVSARFAGSFQALTTPLFNLIFIWT